MHYALMLYMHTVLALYDHHYEHSEGLAASLAQQGRFNEAETVTRQALVLHEAALAGTDVKVLVTVFAMQCPSDQFYRVCVIARTAYHECIIVAFSTYALVAYGSSALRSRSLNMVVV
jgi:hypothetical protein